MLILHEVAKHMTQSHDHITDHVILQLNTFGIVMALMCHIENASYEYMYVCM